MCIRDRYNSVQNVNSCDVNSRNYNRVDKLAYQQNLSEAEVLFNKMWISDSEQYVNSSERRQRASGVPGYSTINRTISVPATGTVTTTTVQPQQRHMYDPVDSSWSQYEPVGSVSSTHQSHVVYDTTDSVSIFLSLIHIYNHFKRGDKNHCNYRQMKIVIF